MIGLSPLSTGHPLRFQPKWVRPSTGSYPRFSLPMDSSPGFASAACDSIAILKARFHCGSVQTLTSPHTATRWLILQKARRHPARGLRLLVGARFQVLFHSPLGVLFTFPSRYWFAIGHRVVFSLSGWSPMIPAGFHVPRRTQVPPRSMSSLRIRVSHPLRIPFPWDSPDSSCHLSRRSYNPGLCPVWAPPLSLAATYGIDFSFSSCRYLDVSVPCVLPRHDGRHAVSASKAEGFPHSDIGGSSRAYRSPPHFAVRCVLHRLSVPRHSPYALSSLTL